jgi:MOSC domain-containing protein YiiM
MPGDRWAIDYRDQPDSQLATTRADVARVIANGQPLELHGDNLFLNLDISPDNLPPGSMVRLGEALLRVTPKAHNGCKKWVQRFGLDAMQLNMAASHRVMRLRGIYFHVVESGRVAVGDRVIVISRPQPEASQQDETRGPASKD